MDERADFEREAGLGADGLQQAQVGGRVGLLGALGAEADEAEQAVASGEGKQQLSAEGIERLALAVVGEEKPPVGIFAVQGGRLVGAREIATTMEELSSKRLGTSSEMPMQCWMPKLRPWRR